MRLDRALLGGRATTLVRNHMALRITARMCIGASEGASGFAALRRAAPPHSPSALLASGLVTYARHVMRHCTQVSAWVLGRRPLPRRFAMATICTCRGGLPEWMTILSAPSSVRHRRFRRGEYPTIEAISSSRRIRYARASYPRIGGTVCYVGDIARIQLGRLLLKLSVTAIVAIAVGGLYVP